MLFENSFSQLQENTSSLNEAYFGKTPEILKAEEQLDKFRNKYMGTYVLAANVNSDPDLIAFDRMIEKIFGFGCFTLKTINIPIANGFTYPVDYRFDAARDGRDLIADKKGFRFKKRFDYSIIMYSYSGIIFNPDFTTGEIMAMALHEIGHNFNSALNKKNGSMTELFITIQFLNIVMEFLNCPIAFVRDIPIMLKQYSNEFRKFADRKGREWRENGSALIAIYDVYSWIKNLQTTVGYTISQLVDVLTLALSSTLTTIFRKLIKITNPAAAINALTGLIWLPMRYRNERTADNFATMYGYGQETISLMSKFEHDEKESASIIMRNVNKIPVLSTIIHLNELPGYLLVSAFDEHPESLTRCQDQLDLLKREVAKDDLDPKMKKVLLADIKACEVQLDNFTKLKGGVKDPYLFKKKYETLMKSLGMDIKNDLLDDKNKFDTYDYALDRASNETENY